MAIGQQLMPAANLALKGTGTFLGLISKLITLLTKYQVTVYAVGAAIAIFTLKKKLAYVASAEFRASLLKEVALLEASGKANTLHTVSLKILAGGYKTAGAAIKAFGKALFANPIGLAAAAVAGVGVAITSIISKSREATKELRELNRKTVDTTTALVESQTQIQRERRALEELKEAATSAAEGSDARKRAIWQINQQYGEYLPHLLTEKSSNNDIAASLRLVNEQLEKKILLQARESAEMDIAQHKTEAVKATVDALMASYEKKFGKKMSTAAIQSLSQAAGEAYDAGSSIQIWKPIEEVFGRDYHWGLGKNSKPGYDFHEWGILGIRDEFEEAITKGRELRATVDGLFGDLSSNQGKRPGTSSLGDLISGGTSGYSPSAASDRESDRERERRAKEEEKERERLAKEAAKKAEEQARLKAQLIIDNEKDLTEKALLEEDRRYGEELKKAGDNAELTALIEQKHRNKIEQIRLDSFNRSLKNLQSQHDLERLEMTNAQAAELLAFNGTEGEKAALKKKHNEELARFDLEYLTELQGMLQSVVDTGALEDMPVSLDDAELQKVKKQLAEVIAQMNQIKGDSSSDGDSAAKGNGQTHSVKQGTGKGEMFGVGQKDWENLFSNLREGKFQAEDLQAVISGIGGAAQEAFSLAAEFSELATRKEEAALKSYKKSQERRKDSLDKRLNSGLISESQYNAEVERMDAEYDAYQEELAIKQAKREKALSITQAIISTALSITQTIAQWGLPWGLIPAAVAAAMGAAQIAIIAAQPISTGAEEGGFINVRREQDGKGFNARLNPSARGFVTRPTVIVGENGAEYVIPHEALENPTIAPVIASMETARRNGKLRSLNFNAVYPATATGFASGGFISGNGGASGTASTAVGSETSQNAALARVLDKLIKKLDEPITASVSMLGKGGIRETQEKYERIRRRGRLG